jgi:hypothetical protein
MRERWPIIGEAYRQDLSTPAVGITNPKVVRRRIAGVNVLDDPCAGTTTNITSQTAMLSMGADKPIRLARNRQPERFGICKYFTHPHTRTQRTRRHRELMIAQSTVRNAMPSACRSPHSFHHCYTIIGERPPLHQRFSAVCCYLTAVAMWVGTRLTGTKLTLLPRSSATSWATDREYLFWAGFLAPGGDNARKPVHGNGQF